MFRWARAGRPKRIRNMRTRRSRSGRTSRRIRWNCPRRRRRRTGRLPQSRALPQEEDSKLSTTYTLLIFFFRRDGVLPPRPLPGPAPSRRLRGDRVRRGFFQPANCFFQPKRCQSGAISLRRSVSRALLTSCTSAALRIVDILSRRWMPMNLALKAGPLRDERPLRKVLIGASVAMTASLEKTGFRTPR